MQLKNVWEPLLYPIIILAAESWKVAILITPHPKLLFPFGQTFTVHQKSSQNCVTRSSASSSSA